MSSVTGESGSKAAPNPEYFITVKNAEEDQRSCTYWSCIMRLEGRARKDLTKRERDHLLRIHTNKSVRTTCPQTGATAVIDRNKNANMKYVCICGSVFLSRDATREHYKKGCSKVASMETLDTFRIINSNLACQDPDDEEAREVDSSENEDENSYNRMMLVPYTHPTQQSQEPEIQEWVKQQIATAFEKSQSLMDERFKLMEQRNQQLFQLERQNTHSLLQFDKDMMKTHYQQDKESIKDDIDGLRKELRNMMDILGQLTKEFQEMKDEFHRSHQVLSGIERQGIKGEFNKRPRQELSGSKKQVVWGN